MAEKSASSARRRPAVVHVSEIGIAVQLCSSPTLDLPVVELWDGSAGLKQSGALDRLKWRFHGLSIYSLPIRESGLYQSGSDTLPNTSNADIARRFVPAWFGLVSRNRRHFTATRDAIANVAEFPHFARLQSSSR
jgi:hypothetical protein